MRFLVDRCAGVTLAKWLRDKGHDVEDASQWLQDPGDAAILERAADEDRILVTIDTDFGLLIFVDERPHRGLVRLPDCPAGERIAILRRLARFIAAPPSGQDHAVRNPDGDDATRASGRTRKKRRKKSLEKEKTEEDRRRKPRRSGRPIQTTIGSALTKAPGSAAHAPADG